MLVGLRWRIHWGGWDGIIILRLLRPEQYFETKIVFTKKKIILKSSIMLFFIV